MAKQKLTANSTLDILTRDEVQGVLKSWSNELTRGARLIRRNLQGNADGAGAVALGGSTDGPAEGMMWAINRFSVALATGVTLGAAGLRVFVNSAESPASVVISQLLTDVYPGDHGCVLVGGDTLRITGAGVTANAQVTVTMSIKEVPELMAWSL